MRRRHELLLIVLLLYATPASSAPLTESWSGELDLITTDNPPSLFSGLPLGTPVSGSIDYDDTCPSATCEVADGTEVSLYTYSDGGADLSFGPVDVAHTPAAPTFEVTLAISNDAPLFLITAEALSDLLGMTIDPGTLVDSWVLTSLQVEADGTRTQFGVSYTSFDTTLYDDTSFRPLPPDPGEVDAVTYGVGEGQFGGIYFGSGLIGAPEPGGPLLLGIGALVLGAGRRAASRLG